ncbi:MAG: GGDEF domain-containing protein [Eubacteriales bacterium]|nr:GGDEF domain-containing protein [Eubacteriales bacterium]
MTLVKRCLRFLLYADIEPEDYNKIYDDCMDNNRTMLRVYAIISFIFFTICLTIGYAVPGMRHKLMAYFVGSVCSGAVIIVSFIFRDKKIIHAVMHVFSVILLASGLLITLVQAPEQMTITLVALLMVVPLLFDDKPYKSLALIIAADIIYLSIAPQVKPGEILALDMVDILVFGTIGVLVGTNVTKVKMQRYIYAREIKLSAIMDGLTGLYNRRRYEHDLKKLSEEEMPSDLAVAVIDINGLKNVNDTLGHDAGDEMIILAANTMTEVFNEVGTCYRIGGDEFAVIMNCPKEAAEARRRLMDELLHKVSGIHIKNMYVSTGIAVHSDMPDLDIIELIKAADGLMYADKNAYYERTGLNRRAR